MYIIQDESTRCDPNVSGGDPAATGGDPASTGGDPASTGGDPAATGETRRPQSSSSLSTQAPNVGPFLKKFTSFSYQIASGMVSSVLDWYGTCTHVF